MSPSRQQAGLGAGTGEERVEPHGGTDAQCHRRAEELGSREAEPGAGIADRLENSQGVVLRRRVRFVPDYGTVFTNGDAIGESPAGINANDKLHASLSATSVSINRKQAGQKYSRKKKRPPPRAYGFTLGPAADRSASLLLSKLLASCWASAAPSTAPHRQRTISLPFTDSMLRFEDKRLIGARE